MARFRFVLRRLDLVALVMVGCWTLGASSILVRSSHASDVVELYAGIPPIAFLAERLGGSFVRVRTIAGASMDPHTFEPTPRQVLALGKARAFFIVGLPFERVLAKRLQQSYPNLEVVDLAQYIQEGQDPHVWLSPQRLNGIAKTIASALVQMLPSKEQEVHKRLSLFLTEAESLEGEVKNMLAPYKGRAFLVYHPAFGHFAENFGLRQLSIEEEGKEPTPKRLQAVVVQAKKEHIRIVIVQPRLDFREARLVAQALDAKLVSVNDLDYDVFDTIRKLGRVLSGALGDSRGT